MTDWRCEWGREAASKGRVVKQVSAVGNWAYFSGATLETRVDKCLGVVSAKMGGSWGVLCTVPTVHLLRSALWSMLISSAAGLPWMSCTGT